jgi:putative transcriptional regulator
MNNEDFKNIMAGLTEVAAIENEEKTPDSEHVHVHIVPDVKVIRTKTGLSQSQFANKFGLAVQTVQAWESGRRNPVGPAVTLLKVISKSPDTVYEALQEG